MLRSVSIQVFNRIMLDSKLNPIPLVDILGRWHCFTKLEKGTSRNYKFSEDICFLKKKVQILFNTVSEYLNQLLLDIILFEEGVTH